MPRYDPATALLVVDVQNDFADPSGSLYVRGGEAVVPFVNAQVEAALRAGAQVLYTQDWHPAVTPHFAKDGGIWPVHCVAGTWGARFHPDLLVSGPVVHKGANGEDGYSGFTMRDPSSGETVATDLEARLRGTGAKRLVIVGLASDYCVLETALDARRRGFSTTVLVPGIRPVELSPGDGERAIRRMQLAGAVMAETFDDDADERPDDWPAERPDDWPAERPDGTPPDPPM